LLIHWGCDDIPCWAVVANVEFSIPFPLIKVRVAASDGGRVRPQHLCVMSQRLDEANRGIPNMLKDSQGQRSKVTYWKDLM